MNMHNATEQAYKNGYIDGLAASKSEWISVKDRLPNETRSYLVVLDNEVIDIRLFNSKNEPYQTWPSMLNKFLFLDNEREWNSTKRVTHWMPLPDPPKMKGDEGK